MECCNYLRRMISWCSYLLMLCLFVVSVSVLGQAPNSDGFINIDCGRASNTSFKNDMTGLTYVSDDPYIETGVKKNISPAFSMGSNFTEFEVLRSFPNDSGTRNCYTLPVSKGLKYLVTAMFYYGNYDGLGYPPTFDLYFGVNFWDTVSTSLQYWYSNDIIALAPANCTQVCLVYTGQGNPFISALQWRPLNDTMYQHANSTQSLNRYARVDFGENKTSLIRSPSDVYDRIWFNYTWFKSMDPSWMAISTNSRISGSTLKIPSVVLQTAIIPSVANSSINLEWIPTNKSTIFLVVLHFAEIMNLENSSRREFDVYVNGDHQDTVQPSFLNASYSNFTTTGQGDYIVSLKSAPNSTLPPMVNAWELYTILPLIYLPTYDGDVTAINSIKANYSVIKGWNGDPCVPRSSSWIGVNCTTNSSNIPRITALNLSSSGLIGELISTFGNLTALQTLVLSDNNLTGLIPSSLDQLISLTFLDLSGNSGLSHTLPQGLQKKQKSGLLKVKFKDTASGSKSNTKKVIFIIVAVVIALLIIGAAALFYWNLKKHKDTNIRPLLSDEFGAGGKILTFDKKQFSFEELKHITNDFSDQIGIGGFGKVFKGCLDNGKEVAVKVRSESSSQGYTQFSNEVENLSRVHHKNLVALVGYCMDSSHIALVYEYLQEGNLEEWIRGKARPFPWKQRLRIACESAQGLEYLHKMCNPPLIHRDVKASNILLTSDMEAKISDFGLVRISTATHVTTQVVGTPGYVDPYYASTAQLNEKSDVYSFGVVLLEIITGKSPILQGSQSDHHLTEFVQNLLSEGNLESILDANMDGQYNLNSIRKVADLALRCTDQPAKRPNMTGVLSELQESLQLEMPCTETSSLVYEDISQSSDYSNNENHVQ